MTDTGSGMAPETLAKVFDPFFTTKEVGKGSGLGLSMVYGFIKQSRGHIKVTSELGRRGAAIRPATGQARDESVAEEAAVPNTYGLLAVGGQERILVVEDEAEVRASVVRQLQSLGYTVDQAEDGRGEGSASFSTPPPCRTTFC